MVYSPLRLSHPLTDQITTTDAEERALRLGRHGFGEETLSRSRRTVEQDPLPGSPFPSEEVREFDRKDDGFLEGFFGLFETCDVGPEDVGRFGEDGTWERGRGGRRVRRGFGGGWRERLDESLKEEGECLRETGREEGREGC